MDPNVSSDANEKHSSQTSVPPSTQQQQQQQHLNPQLAQMELARANMTRELGGIQQQQPFAQQPLVQQQEMMGSSASVLEAQRKRIQEFNQQQQQPVPNSVYGSSDSRNGMIPGSSGQNLINQGLPSAQPVWVNVNNVDLNAYRVFEITVPPTAIPNKPFAFLINGKRTSLQCPAKAKVGTVIRFQLPIAALGPNVPAVPTPNQLREMELKQQHLKFQQQLQQQQQQPLNRPGVATTVQGSLYSRIQKGIQNNQVTSKSAIAQAQALAQLQQRNFAKQLNGEDLKTYKQQVYQQAYKEAYMKAMQDQRARIMKSGGQSNDHNVVSVASSSAHAIASAAVNAVTANLPASKPHITQQQQQKLLLQQQLLLKQKQQQKEQLQLQELQQQQQQQQQMADQLEVNIDDLEGFEEFSMDSAFHKYSGRMLPGCVPHPDSLIESASLAAVAPPDISYKTHFEQETYSKGLLSSPQMETVLCACQRHESSLASGERKGFFLGDGAGVGKGRQLAGIILENWLRGHHRHIWLSVSSDLMVDAQRDLEDVGAGFIPCISINKCEYGPIKKQFQFGVIFVTYSSLVASSGKRSRLKQLLAWCEKDFEGCIMFDESHKAKNLTFQGQAKGSKAAHAVFDLQKGLPNARIVYCSATGASEPANMAYMNRLGLWGPDTAFPAGFDAFRVAVEKGGVGMMELVAMHMKRQGSYICRTLSFEGCTFKIETDAFSPEQLQVYDKAASIFQEMYQALKEGLEDQSLPFDRSENGNDYYSDYSSEDVSSDEEEPLRFHGLKVNQMVMRYFWGAHQRFFRDLCIAFKVPCAVRLAQQAIREGKSCVIGLQTTGGGAADKEHAQYGTTESIDLISSPELTIKRLVKKIYPLPQEPEEILKRKEERRRKRNEQRHRERYEAIAARSRTLRGGAIDYNEGMDSDVEDLFDDEESGAKHRSRNAYKRKLASLRPTRGASRRQDEEDELREAIEASANGGKANEQTGPKKPSSGYEFYRRAMQSNFKLELDASGFKASTGVEMFTALAKKTADGWRQLSDMDKAVYLKMAENDRNRYEREVARENARVAEERRQKMEAKEREWALITSGNYGKSIMSAHDDNDDDECVEEEEDVHNEFCEICDMGGELLICDTCTLSFHIKCLWPRLKRIPKGAWSCAYCIQTGTVTGDVPTAEEAVNNMEFNRNHGQIVDPEAVQERLARTRKVLPTALTTSAPSTEVTKDSDANDGNRISDVADANANESSTSETGANVNSTDGESGVSDDKAANANEEVIESDVKRRKLSDDDDEEYVDENETEKHAQGGDDMENDDMKIAEKEETQAQIYAHYYRISNMRESFLNRINALELPGNALDTLIDQLGGTDAVAELTGRKARLVRTINEKGESVFVYEKRNANGVALATQNLFEKDLFMDRQKRIAVISEAASSGISLQADRRMNNTERRVHITLELPWVADRAIQQLGRTHRSNQASAPEYKLLISPIGGEKRFAAAVAKRLQSLGALTQGDRRANVGQGMALDTFNFETKYGNKALEDFFRGINSKTPKGQFIEDVDEEYVTEFIEDYLKSPERFKVFLPFSWYSSQQEAPKTLPADQIKFFLVAKMWLYKVGIDLSISSNITVGKFLNRILGLEHGKQNMIFSVFLNLFEDLIRKAKKENSYDQGIKEIQGTLAPNVPPKVIDVDSNGNETMHYTVETDMGVSWKDSVQIHEEILKEAEENPLAEVSEKKNTKKERMIGYYKTKNVYVGRHFTVLAVERADPQFLELSAKLPIIRPRTGRQLVLRSAFEKAYVKISPEEAEKLWSAEFDQNMSAKGSSRVQTYEIFTGAVMSLWRCITETVSKMKNNKGRAYEVRILRATIPEIDDAKENDENTEEKDKDNDSDKVNEDSRTDEDKEVKDNLEGATMTDESEKQDVGETNKEENSAKQEGTPGKDREAKDDGSQVNDAKINEEGKSHDVGAVSTSTEIDVVSGAVEDQKMQRLIGVWVPNACIKEVLEAIEEEKKSRIKKEDNVEDMENNSSQLPSANPEDGANVKLEEC